MLETKSYKVSVPSDRWRAGMCAVAESAMVLFLLVVCVEHLAKGDLAFSAMMFFGAWLWAEGVHTSEHKETKAYLFDLLIDGECSLTSKQTAQLNAGGGDEI